MDVKKIYTIAIGNWTRGSGKNLKADVNAPAGELLSVTIDGKLVDETNYTVTGTSATALELKKAYLETLTTGKHTIELVYEDGEAEDTFRIKRAAFNANTGDSFDLYMWVEIMTACLTAIVILMVLRKRKK